MRLIVCIENRNGMTFNNRRVSKDSVVTERLMALSEKKGLFVSSGASSLFTQEQLSKGTIEIFPFTCKPPRNSVIFCDNYSELSAIMPYINTVNEIIVFQWNRDYPADKFFDVDLSDFKKVKSEDFEGKSHENITMEVYKRKWKIW